MRSRKRKTEKRSENEKQEERKYSTRLPDHILDDLPRLTPTDITGMYLLELLDRIAFADDRGSRAALSEASGIDLASVWDAARGDYNVRNHETLGQLANLLDQSESWLSMSTVSPASRRAADRMVRAESLVRQQTPAGTEISMAPDLLFEWRGRNRLCDPGWLLRLFTGSRPDERHADSAQETVVETASTDGFAAVEEKLRTAEATPQSIELLRHCWRRNNIALSELSPGVWHDPPTEDAVRQALRRANRSLTAIGHTRRLRLARGVLFWNQTSD